MTCLNALRLAMEVLNLFFENILLEAALALS